MDDKNAEEPPVQLLRFNKIINVDTQSKTGITLIGEAYDIAGIVGVHIPSEMLLILAAIFSTYRAQPTFEGEKKPVNAVFQTSGYGIRDAKNGSCILELKCGPELTLCFAIPSGEIMEISQRFKAAAEKEAPGNTQAKSNSTSANQDGR